jgi:transposase
MQAFVSVYVDMAATADAVRAAVAELPNPKGVFEVSVDCNSVTDIFGCRIAVDLTGAFDERTEGLAIARRYAEQLSRALGVPAFPFYDLLRRDHTAS